VYDRYIYFAIVRCGCVVVAGCGTCRYALDIARAVCYLHDARIVHLDLKPANVIVTLGDVCKLGDFGCCQVNTAAFSFICFYSLVPVLSTRCYWC